MDEGAVSLLRQSSGIREARRQISVLTAALEKGSVLPLLWGRSNGIPVQGKDAT